MDTFDAIHQRRSVKHYDPAHEMTEDEIRKLLEAAVVSPTSFNMQNWRFVVVRDKELRRQLREASYNQAQVTDASIVILLTANLESYRLDPNRYWANAPKEIAEMLTGWMVPFYDGNEQLKRDEAMRSAGIAGQTIMLAAKAMGYDSCPMVGYEPEKVASIINLPEDHVLGFMITVGKAAKPAMPRSGQLPFDEVVIWDHF